MKSIEIEKANNVLRATEKQLQELAGEAIRKGEYDANFTLAKWAIQVGRLVNGHELKPTGNGDASRASPPAKRARAVRKPLTRKAPATNGYPKFIRSGNDLVKIGWSKKSREEYQHRAPYGALSALARSLHEGGADGSLVNAYDLMPLEDPSTSSEIPGYQVYLCLAWLRDCGFVKQQGRQGYTIPDVDNLPALVEESWTKLSNNGE